MKRVSLFFKENIFVILIYLVLSIIFTYPLIKNLSGTIPGWPMDGYNYMWNIDTFWYEVFRLSNPFSTDRIFYPIGVSLVSHTYAPFISLLGLPFLNSLTLYMNLLIIVSFIIGSFSFYHLSQIFIKDKRLSILSGFVYGFSPIMVSYVTSQHYYFLFASALMPIIPLLILREKNKNDIQKSIILLWIIFFIDYYIFIVSSILFLIVILSTVKNKLYKIKDLYKPFLLFGVLPAIIYIFLIFRGSESGISLFKDNGYPTICNINVANLIYPSPHNSVLLNYKNKFNIDLDTPSYYIGYLVLVFSLIGTFTIKGQWKMKIFVVFGIIILALSIGPNIRYNASITSLSYSPFEMFSKLPYMNMVDCPKRFIVGLQMSIAMLFSIGGYYLINKIQSKKFKLLFIFIISMVIFIEYFSFNIPVSEVYIPTVYQTIKSDKNNRTILELPSGITESKRGWGYDWSISGLHLMQHYWQSYHHKPRIGGSLSRVSNSIYSYFESEPIIKYLFDVSTINSNVDEVIFNREEVELLITKYQLGYIVFSPNPRQEVYVKAVKSIFREQIIEEITDERGYLLIKLINI